MWFPWSENIKKRACRYLLQRYLGNFLEEKLTLDQLSVDLYNGTGTVCDVSLDCDALNELGDAQNWPLEIVDGHMKKITVSIPWSTLFKDDSIVTVNGLSVTVQPKVRTEKVPTMLESMWTSMTSSMQLAAECLKEEDGPQETSPVEGIEMFATAIDSILSRVKVKFEDTKIRIEHVPKNGDRGIALEVHIKDIDYFDEAGTEPKPDTSDPDKSKTYIVATCSNKKIKFEGVTLYTDEYPSKLRTMARSLIMEKSMSSQGGKTGSQVDNQDMIYQSTLSDVFYETKSIVSTLESEPVKEQAEPKSQIESRELSPVEKVNQPDPILFAKLMGQQELELNMTQSNGDGPKVEMDLSLGSFIVFISPRQLHTIIELVDALNQPHLEDTSNLPTRSPAMNMQCKPMKQADFQRIEAQLAGNLEKRHSKLTTGHGWTGTSYDSDADSDKFLPMTSPGNQMTDSTSSISTMSNSITSSASAPTAAPRIKRNKKAPRVEGDPTAELTRIRLKISSVACVLLHKNILVPKHHGSDCISSASAGRMQEVSNMFYKDLEPFSLIDDFTAGNEALDRITGRNHLRLLTSEITLDASEKLTSRGSNSVGELCIRHLLVRECLYFYGDTKHLDPHGFDLIRFDIKEDDDTVSQHSGSTSTSPKSQPNIQVNFKQTSKYSRVSGEKVLANPATDITIKCTPFYLDVELTLMERMSATFFPETAAQASPPAATVTSQNQLSVALHCPSIDTVLRFPIADLRPEAIHGVREIRPDYLVFRFENATISSQQAPSLRPLPTAVSLRCTQMDLYYYENESLPGTHIARTAMDDYLSDTNLMTGTRPSAVMPTISITFKPPTPPNSVFDVEDEPLNIDATANPMTTSMYVWNNLTTTQPSPFSGMKQATITKHEVNLHDDNEETIITPGTEEEMSAFTASSIELSAIHLEFILPVLSLQLESKQLYERIYNRINSDLLLWEPQLIDQYDVSPLAYGSLNPAFGTCRGSYESDSESTASDEDASLFASSISHVRRGLRRTKSQAGDMHNFCLTLKVGKGLLTLYTPVRDSNKRVVPGQMGELVLEAHHLSMCQVSGLYGKAKTAQLCLRSQKTTLYHESLLTIPSEKPRLRRYGSILPSHLKPTIYPSGKGVQIKELFKKDMFTLALKIDPDPESDSAKGICIAIGIEQATLRYRGDKGISWLSQLMDVIDVIDYPVPGYKPSNMVSQLHVHILDCAVDYRPLYLPIRTVLTLGNFRITSSVLAETNTSCLRFHAQECTLFLMQLHGTKPNVAVPQDNDKAPNVAKDYVCVVDLGLFELSLRSEDKINCPADRPLVDLMASNNMVTLSTCWDSASALCRLLTYAASDGDSQPPYDHSSRHTSICSDQPLEQLVGLEDKPLEEVRELSPNEIQQVNDLMEEAMKESPNTTLEESSDLNSSTDKETGGVEIFFFPDESNMKRKLPPQTIPENEPISLEPEEQSIQALVDALDAKPTHVQVAKELGDPMAPPKVTPRKFRRKSKKSSESADEEFYVVEKETLTEDNDLEEPVVHWLGSGPVHMCEEHFTVPQTRADVLSAPKSFPLPTLRYTLCEMSITWNMYGGNDFRPSGDSPPAKKTVTIEGDVRKQGSPNASQRDAEYKVYDGDRAVTAAYRNTGVRWSSGSDRVKAAKPPKMRNLKDRGGPLRDRGTRVMLCLNKIKFQYEVYPTGGLHASRHALAIKKIEVVDHVLCSDINKLLCQYKMKDEPERPDAHMLIVKAVHLRPDPTLSSQECCLKVSLLPLWFNLDQDTLAFLVGYFSKLGSDEFSDDDSKSISGLSTDSSGSRQTTPTHRPPVMSIASHLRDPPPTPTSLGDADSLTLNDTVIRNNEPLMETYEAERMVSENLIQLEEDFNKLGIQEKPVTKMPVDPEYVDDSPIYFRRVVFSPEVPIRLDYVGKRVDLSAGPVAGLLMGLGQLNCSELTLKRLDYKLGLLGLEKLIQWALHEWLSDIKRHQLPGLLSGIGPMHSLLQLITGIRDLVWLPVEQWRRDGRLVHGLRRGAASFTARTAVAALDITTRLLQLIQATAETAFDMLTPGPTLQLQDAYERRERRRRRRHDPARHPADIREGVASAYQTVKEGFADQAATMAAAARWQHGVGVLRHLPGAAVAPLALAAAGAADVLGGVRASLAPHHHADHNHKWRTNKHQDFTDNMD